jgi:AraC family transcriptional regulator
MESKRQQAEERVLHIKNMVCPRCIMVVRDRLIQIGLKVDHVELGYAKVVAPSHNELDLQRVNEVLEEVGFELMFDQEAVLVERIKVLVINYLYELEKKNVEALSSYLSRNLGKNYTYLSKLFSKVEGRTLQKYLVLQKTERVKELLDYGELTLSQIASKLGYSSVHYLSSQFKSVTGQAVSTYKEKGNIKRRPLNDL